MGPGLMLLRYTLAVLFWSGFVLHYSDGIFSVDLSGIQLPKFSLPLNFDNLFQPNQHQAHTAAHRRHHDRRSFLPQIFSTQIPPPTYRSYDGGPDVFSAERSQEFPDELNTIDMETQMKVLDSELVTNMKNQKYSPQSSTPAPVDNNETFTKPQNGSIFPDLGVLKQLFQWGGQSAKSFAICHACKVGAGLFMLRARGGASEESLLQTAQFGCNFFKIAPDEMCQGLISRFGPVLYYIVMQRPELSADIFCGMILQSVGCATKDPNTEWDVLASRTLSVKKRSPENLKVADVVIPKGIESMKILHITDIHVDPHYKPGANAECETEICCRQYDRAAALSGKGAGYYGDYRKCDIPYFAFENALLHISQTHQDIDLIYMTGDLVPHNVWSTDPEENVQIVRNCSNLIHRYFPNTQVIPVVGNHESHPVNLFSPYGVPSRFSTDWVYATSAKSWSQWIPPQAVPTFLHGGFYSVIIRPDFKVIVLNTNLCYTYNFWQMYEDKDPSGQLKWLAHELEIAESLGQKVHLLGHVPPGHEECWSVWSKNFYQVVTRFSSTVRAQFYGHTHYEEFKLFYDPTDRARASNTIFVSGSLTPYTNLNPSYKIFHVDGTRGAESTYHILDSDTWIYNLTEANSHPGRPPRWFRLYRATENYRIPNLLPQSLHTLVRRMSSNITEFNQYYRHYYKAAGAKKSSDCDALCRKRHLCDIVTPYQQRQTECMHLQGKLDGVILPMRIFETREPSSRSSLGAEIISALSAEEKSSSPSDNPSQSFFDRIFGSRRFFFGR